MSTKPGVTSKPSASMRSRAALASTRPTSDDLSVRDRDVGGTRRRAGAVDDGAAGDDEIEIAALTTSTSRPRCAPNNPARASSSMSLGVLAQLVDDTGILRVGVREVGRPRDAIGADQRPQQRRGALAGIEADPALALEVLAGRQRERGRRPAVALEELVEPVHPVRDPPAAALEHDHLQLRETLEHAAVGEVRQRQLLVDQQDQRVVRARRHQSAERARRARHVGEARGMERDRQTRLRERFPHRRVRPVVQRPVVVRVRSRESGLQSEPRDAVHLFGRALRVLQRQRADAGEPIRRPARTSRRASRCRPCTTRPRDRGLRSRRASSRDPGYITATSMPSASSTFTRSCASKPAGFRSS